MAETDRDDAPQPAARTGWPGWPIATAICIRFYSRLPVPAMPGEAPHAAPDFRLVPKALPLAGLAIALPAALVLLLGGLVRLDPLLAASLAVAAGAIVTGALHEDGLADSADGLFGGATPERRLEIMRDSRIGSYGALALLLSVLLRTAALAAIWKAAGPLAAAAALLAAAPWSRVEGIRLLAILPPARPDGAAAAVGRPERDVLPLAYGLAGAIAAGLALVAGLPLGGLALGLALAVAATALLARAARRLIGGQTGDIIGASQQLAEIAIYIGLAAGFS